MRHGKGKGTPFKNVSDNGGRNRRDHNSAEIGYLQSSQDHFQGKNGTGDGCIKGSRNTTGGTAGHQVSHPFIGEMQQLPHRRAQGRSDLGNGSLPAHRSTRSDADSRRQRLDHRHNRPDATSVKCHGLHNLRYTVTFGLAGKTVDKRSINGSSDGWNDKQVVRRNILDVATQSSVGQGLHRFDQPPKEHGP